MSFLSGLGVAVLLLGLVGALMYRDSRRGRALTEHHRREGRLR